MKCSKILSQSEFEVDGSHGMGRYGWALRFGEKA